MVLPECTRTTRLDSSQQVYFLREWWWRASLDQHAI